MSAPTHTTPSGQIDLELGAPAPACDEEFDFPPFTFTDDTTPRQIVHWWDMLVNVYEPAQKTAQQMAILHDQEVVALKGRKDTEAARRRSQSREQLERAHATAQRAEAEAIVVFSGTQELYHERLFELVRQVHGVTLSLDEQADYIEMFWDCLQRPLIENDADTTLAAFVRDVFGAPETAPADMAGAQ